MNFLNRHLHTLLVQGAQRSVTVRTTVTIVALSCIVGVLSAAISIPIMQNRERARLETGIRELASTVASTVSIACFVGDETLAHEVANGLLTNRSVAHVLIRGEDRVLAELHRPGTTPKASRVAANVVRSIVSPFDRTIVVGELQIMPAAEEIQEQAGAHARYLAILLALQAAALAGVVARVVLRSIVRPIKHISDDLHRLQAEHGEQLASPAGNERNEIGRLARDVNALITRLAGLLSSERQLRQERERSERQLRLIFENAENGIFVVDGQGNLLSWNPALARELHLPTVRPAGAPAPRLDLLLPPESKVFELAQRCLVSTHAASGDFEVASESGGTRWINLLLQPIEPNRLQGMLSDITARKRSEADALALAQRDSLTGLLNRRGMEHVLGSMLGVSGSKARPFALMLLDLDWFKQVNDTHGHVAGDVVLRVVSERLQRNVRPQDTVARLGGDEFVVLLTNATDAASTRQLGIRLIASISEPIPLANGAEAHVGASIGVAFSGKDTHSAEGLLRIADAAMYQAKQAGRARCHIASDERATALERSG